MNLKAVLASAVACVSFNAFAQNTWQNQPRVLRAAQQLQSKVEVFDEKLHAIEAPAELIQLVHHFEDTVVEVVTLAGTGTRAEVVAELTHLNEDVETIQTKLYGPTVPHDPNVRRAWFSVRDWTRYLNRQVYQGW